MLDMDPRLFFGITFTIIVVAMLGVRRYRRQNVLLAGGGFVLFQVVFALAIDKPTEAPVLVLLGVSAGAMMQQGVDAERQRERERAARLGV